MSSHRMSRSVETDLSQILTGLANASSNEPNKRFIAARWFNRLYYDTRKWNENFLRLLHTYPGFSSNPTLEDYSHFIDWLRGYRYDTLGNFYSLLYDIRSGGVEADLCTNLQVLARRFIIDFDWLRVQNPRVYRLIQHYIMFASEHRGQILTLLQNVARIVSEFEPQDAQWHMDNSPQVVAMIRDYEERSNNELAKLRKIALNAGISLLDVGEYELALATEGSANPMLIAIGEVTTGNKYVNEGQVVAFGDQSQGIGLFSSDTPTQTLLTELEKLKQVMRAKANEPEHFESVAAIAKAERAISEKNESKAISALKAAGKWALDAATEIGTSVAAEVIKKSMGLA